MEMINFADCKQIRAYEDRYLGKLIFSWQKEEEWSH